MDRYIVVQRPDREAVLAITVYLPDRGVLGEARIADRKLGYDVVKTGSQLRTPLSVFFLTYCVVHFQYILSICEVSSIYRGRKKIRRE